MLHLSCFVCFRLRIMVYCVGLGSKLGASLGPYGKALAWSTSPMFKYELVLMYRKLSELLFVFVLLFMTRSDPLNSDNSRTLT